ncbi:MAG: ankyrin repeat domain-containing protein [Micavibrio sp.]|nr:MAG: ankyrin repeat domain-containing protein [Micavibrio sp.]
MNGQDTENFIILLYSEKWLEAENMLDQGLDINAIGHSGRTALTAMAASMKHDAMEFLLKHKADPNLNPPGYSAIHWSILQRDDKGLDLLLEYGTDPNLRKPRTAETPLLQAIRHGTDHAVEKLLEKGADPNLRDRDNTPPLLLAAEFQRNKNGLLGAMIGKGATTQDWTDRERERLFQACSVADTLINMDKIMQNYAEQKKRDAVQQKHGGLRRYIKMRKP